MSELSTITRDESLADSSNMDYIEWLEAQLNDPVMLDRAAGNERAGAVDYNLSLIMSMDPHATDEKPQEVESKVRLKNGIGAAATYGYWTSRQRSAERNARLVEKLEQYEKDDADPLRTKMKKAAARYGIRAAMLGTATTAYAAAYMWSKDTSVAVTAIAENIDLMPELTSFDNVLIAAGGAGQGHIDITPELQAKGYENGINIQTVPVEYSGSMGLNPGEESMDRSTDTGYRNMMASYNALVADGQPAHLVGYSEGSLVAQKAAWDIWNANGGSYPEGTRVTVIGSPYSTTGIGHGHFGEIADFALDPMGIPLDHKLPPGTEIVYYDGDPYANGGNNISSTVAFDFIAGLAAGTHGIPDLNQPPDYVFTDEDGVIHKVYSSDQVLVGAIETALNMKLNNTEAAVNAINAFFPHAPLPGQEVKPDIRAGLMYAAEAADYQIDPSGNTRIMRDLVESMPDEWKELGQKGFDNFNKLAEAMADIQSGRVDPLTGASRIMQIAADMFGGVQEVMNGNPIQGGMNMGIDAITNLIKQYTGIDVSPQARAFVEALTSNANYQAGGGIDASMSADSITQNLQTALQNMTKPLADSLAQMQQQLPAPTSASTAPRLELPSLMPAPSELPKLPLPTGTAEVHANVGITPTQLPEIAPPVVEAPAPVPSAPPKPEIPTWEPAPAAPAPVETYIPPVVEAPAPVPEVIPMPAPEPFAPIVPPPAPEAPAAPALPGLPNLGMPFLGSLFGGGNTASSPGAEVHSGAGINLTPLPDLSPAGSGTSSANLSGI